MFPLSETGRLFAICDLAGDWIFWCAFHPASVCSFPESWHDYWKQYFRSFGRQICIPVSPNWRYKQNYDINKWQVWIREAFLGRISASPGATDGWWHCWQNIQTYNSLPPCQEIDIHSWRKRLLHPGMMCLFCDYFYFISPRGLRTGCLV